MPNKNIVITGATSGIGRETAVALSKQGNTVFLLVRSMAKGEAEKRNILVQSRSSDVHLIICDLSSLASVRAAADEIKSLTDTVDILINNAGGAFPAHKMSPDGFEMTFQVNYLSHFLLTLSLMPLLERGKARVINVSSEGHKVAKVNFDDLQSQLSYKSITAYGNAKLFGIYFAKSLTEKYSSKGITAYSLHPGIVETEFGADAKGLFRWMLIFATPMMITPEEGAETTVFLASQTGIEALSGEYFKKKKLAKPASLALDAQARETLWGKSLEMVKGYL